MANDEKSGSTPTSVAKDVVVFLSYKLTDSEGETLDQAEAEDPFLYLHSHDNVVTGLEKALEGLRMGDDFDVTLKPEEGFGAIVKDSERVVPRDAFPPDIHLDPGFEFAVEEADDVYPLWVKRVEAHHVVADLNHPLAGKSLRFEGKVVGMRKAKGTELDHGHPHGRSGDEGHGEEEE